MNKLIYKCRSYGLGGFVDLERLIFPSLCGEDVSLDCVPAGLLLGSAAVLSGELSGGRVILYLGVTGFRISRCNFCHSWCVFLNNSDIIKSAFYCFERVLEWI